MTHGQINVQMYVMSIMFGYFIRRVDKRFQLERSAGLLDEADGKEEALKKLERLFNDADSLEIANSPDSVESPTSSDSSEASTSGVLQGICEISINLLCIVIFQPSYYKLYWTVI